MKVNYEFVCLKDVKSFKKDNIYFGVMVDTFKYNILNENESIESQLKLICYKENNIPKYEVSNEFFKLKD